MKVLQLTQRFPPAIGGVENHVANLATKLTENGVAVEVFTTDSMRDVPFQRLLANDLQFTFKVRRFHAFKVADLPHGLGIVAPSMIPRTFSQTADIIHAHAYGYFSTDVGALVRRIRSIPLVITPHSDPGRQSTVKRIFDIVVPALTLYWADRIIALTRIEAEFLKGLGIPAKRIAVIPNGINLAEFKGAKTKPKVKGVASILFVGRVYPQQKGLEILIQALSYVSCPRQLRLNIVGEDWGGVSTALMLARKLGVKDRVTVLGRLRREDLLALYASADLLVLPSFFEPFGIVLLEAMASGLPVIASRVGGIPEVVEDGKTGLLFEPGDAEELSAAIEELLSDDSLRRDMGQAGRERASLFSWDLIVPRIKRVYQEVRAQNAN